jgi:hypothetical protein
LDARIIVQNNYFRPEINISKAEAIGMIISATYPQYSYNPNISSTWENQVVNFALQK